MLQTVLAAPSRLHISSIANKIKSIAHSYERWTRYRKTVSELSKLTDKELSDIGIHRGVIHSIAMEEKYDDQ